ncbi:hypothetical protein ACA910_019924 [Epithemia clementina (nom. ined.)]
MDSQKQSSEKSDDDPKSYDIFRDSLLRYLGYANEVGESFRYQFPRLLVPSYVVSCGYCVADAITSGIDEWNHRPSSANNVHHDRLSSSVREEDRIHDTARATIDTLLWQSLASVAIPGATINMIVKASRWAVRRSPFALPLVVMEWGPTATGLSSIPLIIRPIDALVDCLMDNTIRSLWKKQMENQDK